MIRQRHRRCAGCLVQGCGAGWFQLVREVVCSLYGGGNIKLACSAWRQVCRDDLKCGMLELCLDRERDGVICMDERL